MSGRRPSREERQLWRSAMRDVEAWREADSEEPRPSPPPPTPPVPRAKRGGATPAPVSQPQKPALTPGRAIGVDRRLAERLKRGRLPIEATLDLHGLTQRAAHAAVRDFIGRSVEHGLRTLLIVTGKGRGDGGGVLKPALPQWLNEPGLRDHVLALAEARPEHGGAGALYVLLRRRRPA